MSHATPTHQAVPTHLEYSAQIAHVEDVVKTWGMVHPGLRDSKLQKYRPKSRAQGSNKKLFTIPASLDCPPRKCVSNPDLGLHKFAGYPHPYGLV